MKTPSLVPVIAAAFLFMSSLCAYSEGKVYLVLGSDTAIWDGMSVSSYHSHYQLDLFTSPQRNAHAVMDPSFRARFRDSFGRPLTMTWWMMAGNVFRFADNTDVPLANTMTLHLMKQYYGEEARSNGDELSLHYHTFAWTDYNGDGKFYWNQSHTFAECRADFDQTLAQFLLEEEVFPVSFRSGWHYMDNGWQQYLNTLLPYSMHNDYPHVRQSTAEPIDNVFDWSQAPGQFVPYVPSPENYQLPGNGHGWNVRSIYMANMSPTLMDQVFAQAAAGIDQVACLWAHLPETDFPDNIARIDSLVHGIAANYPAVQFKYCTATEAMKLWRRVQDDTAPAVTVREQPSGDQLYFQIDTDEPLFQPAPFVAVKDLYERYTVLPSTKTGDRTWRTAEPVSASMIVKLGVAAIDTAGNLRTRIIRYFPDDQYIDNCDSAYAETAGSWSSSSTTAWGTDSRSVTLSGTDVVKARWSPTITRSGHYNVFMQIPAVANGAGMRTFRFLTNDVPVDSAFLAGPVSGNAWVYVGTPVFTANARNAIEMEVSGAGQAGTVVVADVMKISPLVRDRELSVPDAPIVLDAFPEGDTVRTHVRMENRGLGNLSITGIRASRDVISATGPFPIILPAMGSAAVPVSIAAVAQGSFSDTLTVLSDDPSTPEYPFAVGYRVVPYFTIADNDDSTAYHETGEWYYSNAQACGKTSRYSPLSSSPDAHALFTLKVREEGDFDLLRIVPATVNAATRALYVIAVNGGIVDSLYADQNSGSGAWAFLGRYHLPAQASVTVTVRKATGSQGSVLRADAIKAAKAVATGVTDGRPEEAPRDVTLLQNWPNPWNPSTTIGYTVGVHGSEFMVHGTEVKLVVYDLLGREVAVLVDEKQAPGRYTVRFDAGRLASGVYLYRLQAGSYVETRRMVLLR